jgi:hypothetical protein
MHTNPIILVKNTPSLLRQPTNSSHYIIFKADTLVVSLIALEIDNKAQVKVTFGYSNTDSTALNAMKINFWCV